MFIEHRYRTKEQWYDRRGKPFTPNTHYWVGGNTTFYGAALMRLRKGDFEDAPARGRRLARLADPARGPRPLLRRGREAVVRARHARRRSRPRRATSRPTPSRPSAHDPGIAQLKTHWRTRAGGRSPCRWASAGRGPPGHLALHQVQDLRRLSLPGEGQVRRAHLRHRAAAGAAQRDPAHRPQGRCGWRPTPPGRTVTDVVCAEPRRRGALERRHRGAGRRRGEHRGAAAGLGQRRASERPRQRLRPGRAQLHVPHPDGDGLDDRRRTGR